MIKKQMLLCVAVVVCLGSALPQNGGTFTFQDRSSSDEVSQRKGRVGGNFPNKKPTPNPGVVYYATNSAGSYNYNQYYNSIKQTRRPATRGPVTRPNRNSGGIFFPKTGANVDRPQPQNQPPPTSRPQAQPSLTVRPQKQPDTVTVVNGIGIRGGSEDLTLPSDVPVTTQMNLPTPECPNGKSFCSNVTNYPSEMLESLMSGFDNNILDLAKPVNIDIVNPKEVHAKFHPADRGDTPACKSITQAYCPQVARNLRNEKTWIVNDVNVSGVKLRQRIDTVKCVDKKKPCTDLLQQGIAQGFTTECRQSYTYIKLLAVGQGKDQKVKTEPFRFPSHCQCFVVPVKFKLRIGVRNVTEVVTTIDSEGITET